MKDLIRYAIFELFRAIFLFCCKIFDLSFYFHLNFTFVLLSIFMLLLCSFSFYFLFFIFLIILQTLFSPLYILLLFLFFPVFASFHDNFFQYVFSIFFSLLIFFSLYVFCFTIVVSMIVTTSFKPTYWWLLAQINTLFYLLVCLVLGIKILHLIKRIEERLNTLSVEKT